MTRTRRKRWLFLLTGLGALSLCVVAGALAFAAWPRLRAPTERLRNTSESQEAVFLAASDDYFEHISRRPVLEPQTHALKELAGLQVWLDDKAITMLEQACPGTKSVSDVYLVEATVRLREETATVFYPGGSGKATFWRLSIERLKRCRLAD